MDETASPNTMSNRNPVINSPRTIQSPTSSFFIGSNDDQIELARSRAAIFRRDVKSARAPPPPLSSTSGLTKDKINDLFQNCMKLATENKINQKNMWELKLIDHLSDIINVEAEAHAETNFQKASCTLEAGVKIYSLRVDAVHSEAYKVLGQLIRAGEEEQLETAGEDCQTSNEDDGRNSKKDTGTMKISPLSTLEPSSETLNIKKFDVAFAVDPLYHHISAQFDEGGASGLLLNSLGVYGDCRILFDSMEVPGKSITSPILDANSDTIDLSFLKEYVEQMVKCVPERNEISPTLSEIVCQLGGHDERALNDFDRVPDSSPTAFPVSENNLWSNDEWFNDFGPEACDLGEESITNEGFNFGEAGSLSHDEEGRYEEFPLYLIQGQGPEVLSQRNAWAGPDHWKYNKPKDTSELHKSGVTSNRSKDKTPEVDIDFSEGLNQDSSHIFAPPKNPKSLLLPVKRRVPKSNRLPEDCHYQPQDLFKFFLHPNKCFGRRRATFTDGDFQKHGNGIHDDMPLWGNESAYYWQYDDTFMGGDEEEPADLIFQPRQVEKTKVQHDQTSKEVDVHDLKDALWSHLQESVHDTDMVCKGQVSFKRVLAAFPSDREGAESENISPHLCFICLLHLASEHGLSIQGSPDLDDLTVNLLPVESS